MPFKDLDVYLEVARALLAGHNPYAVAEAYYPLPFYFIFIPLAYLPVPLAHGIWTGVQALTLVAILRRRSVLALLFAPVLLAFLMGQISIPMLGVLALLQAGRFGGVALALLMLKPQLALFLAPWQVWQWCRNERGQIAACIATGSVLAGAAFGVEPLWLVNWMGLSGERLRAPLSPSLWGALAPLPAGMYWLAGGAASVALLAWAYRSAHFDLVAVVSLFVNPVIISYDLTLLSLFVRTRGEWVSVMAASWVAFGLSAAWPARGEWPSVLVTLLVLLLVLRGGRAVRMAETRGEGLKVRDANSAVSRAKVLVENAIRR